MAHIAALGLKTYFKLTHYPLAIQLDSIEF